MRGRILMAVVVAMVLCTAGSAPAVTVVCNGNGSACGGSGPRDYWYEVTTDQQYDYFVFDVVTGDGNVSNYSNTTAATLVSGSWVTMDSDDYLCNLFGIGGTLDIHTPATAHGGGPVTPNGSCNRCVFWTVDPLVPAGTYGFGYDNATAPMDVFWALQYAVGFSTVSDWSQVVGTGLGPVHGPAPEPATLSLLAVGIGTLLLRKRRK